MKDDKYPKNNCNCIGGGDKREFTQQKKPFQATLLLVDPRSAVCGPLVNALLEP